MDASASPVPTAPPRSVLGGGAASENDSADDDEDLREYRLARAESSSDLDDSEDCNSGDDMPGLEGAAAGAARYREERLRVPAATDSPIRGSPGKLSARQRMRRQATEERRKSASAALVPPDAARRPAATALSVPLLAVISGASRPQTGLLATEDCGVSSSSSSGGGAGGAAAALFLELLGAAAQSSRATRRLVARAAATHGPMLARYLREAARRGPAPARALARQLARFDRYEAALRRRSGGEAADAALADTAPACGGRAALSAAALGSLRALRAAGRRLLDDWAQWVVRLQEYVLRRSGAGAPKTRRVEAGGAHGDDWFYTLLPALLPAMEARAAPLVRLLRVLTDTAAFTTLEEALATGDDAAAAPDDSSLLLLAGTQAAGDLVNYLTVRTAAAQATSTMDLYRFLMMLLLCCAWPYVLLCTHVMMGFVSDVDPREWRRLSPRMLSTSFSHIHPAQSVDSNTSVNSNSAPPTDVLSIVFQCVCMPFGGGGDSAAAATGPSQEAYSARASARQFVLQSLQGFARRPRRSSPSSSRKSRARKQQQAHQKGSGSTEAAAVVVGRPNTVDVLRRLLREQQEQHWRRVPGTRPLGGPQYDEEEENTDVNEEKPQQSAGHPSLFVSETDAADFFPTTVPLAFTTGNLPRGHHTRNTDDDDDEDEGLRGEVCDGTLWRLQLSLERLSAGLALVPSDSLEDDRVLLLRRQERHATLWLNTGMPAARWVAAALLLPLAVVAQKQQQRRLRDLLSQRALRREVSACGALSAVPTADLSAAAALLMDVALCRNRARIVDGFLQTLAAEPNWWFRRSPAAAAAADYARYGTAAPFVTAAFARAMSGHPLATVVRLAVRAPRPLPVSAGRYSDETSAAYDVLSCFASFELVFSFPPAVAAVLLPTRLAGDDASEDAELFWRHRGDDGCGRWSATFGYLCSLLYARLLLRGQRKTLQTRQNDDHALLRVLGRGSAAEERQHRLAERGLGSGYYALSFAVDTVLAFTQHEAEAHCYRITALLAAAGGLRSLTELCHHLDRELRGLRAVSFALDTQGSGSGGAAATALADSVAALLLVALDPTRLPAKFIHSRTATAVEAIVATIGGMGGASAANETSALQTRLRPLVSQLTFNDFYGLRGGRDFSFR